MLSHKIPASNFAEGRCGSHQYVYIVCARCCCCHGYVQVDLSDDYVLFMMFADGQWENDMTGIEFEEDGGQSKQLTMSEKEFHEFVGLLKEPDEPESRKK